MNQRWQALGIVVCGTLAIRCAVLAILVLRQPPYAPTKRLWTGLAIDRRKNEWAISPSTPGRYRSS
jgi:hypothetical protein